MRSVSDPPHRAAAIEVQGLRKTYPGGVEAVAGIDFSVAPGEVFGLLGPNGAGKSTTIGMLTTTVRPTAGTASLGGFDVATDPLRARAISSVVFQEPVVDRALTGRATMQLHARLWRVPEARAADRISELAGVLGLVELLDRPVGGYSGGERRRLEIARALVSDPQVLFLDEPTVGLDPLIRRELLDVIAGLRERYRTTILLTTHYLEEAQSLCDRVAIVHSGRIVACGAPHELLAALGDQVIELRTNGDGPSAALEALRAGGIPTGDVFVVGSTLTVPLRGRMPADVIAALDLNGTAVATRPPTLDDVYVRLTGARIGDDA